MGRRTRTEILADGVSVLQEGEQLVQKLAGHRAVVYQAVRVSSTAHAHKRA
jgi:hypothetical protein